MSRLLDGWHLFSIQLRLSDFSKPLSSGRTRSVGLFLHGMLTYILILWSSRLETNVLAKCDPHIVHPLAA